MIDQDRELDALRKRVRELERWFETQDQHIRYLERERQKLSALVNNTDAGFLLVDAEHRVVWANIIFIERFAPDQAGGQSGQDPLTRSWLPARSPTTSSTAIPAAGADTSTPRSCPSRRRKARWTRP
jgi:hypothetical protein